MDTKFSISKEYIPFWSEIADTYERWIENPPVQLFERNRERYTCYELIGMYCDFIQFYDSTLSMEEALVNIWAEDYGYYNCFPAGDVSDPDRAENRADFCWFMAETIREVIDGAE